MRLILHSLCMIYWVSQHENKFAFLIQVDFNWMQKWPLDISAAIYQNNHNMWFWTCARHRAPTMPQQGVWVEKAVYVSFKDWKYEFRGPSPLDWQQETSVACWESGEKVGALKFNSNPVDHDTLLWASTSKAHTRWTSDKSKCLMSHWKQ